MKSFKEMIGNALHENGESWADVVYSTLEDSDLDCEWDGRDSPNEPFTIWTHNTIYYLMLGDYYPSWIDSVSRDPPNECNERTPR